MQTTNFDISTATLLAYNHQAGNGPTQSLYRTPDGRFFLHTDPPADQGFFTPLEEEDAAAYYTNLPERAANYLEAFGSESGRAWMIRRARTLRRQLKENRKWGEAKKARALYELMGIYWDLIQTIPIGI